MTYQIALGADTGSIEDPDQMVLVTLPDECADMSIDDLEDYIDSTWVDSQALVGVRDLTDSFRLALQAEGVSAQTIERVVQTVLDAVDNNS